MILFVQLFLAHIIGDFFLQTDKWILDKERRKARSPFLYTHTLIHFSLILLIVGSLQFLKSALFIAGTHFFIDLVKLLIQKEATKRIWFFIDQALHLIVLVCVWTYLYDIDLYIEMIRSPKALLLLTAILTLMFPSSIFIRTVVSRWRPDTGIGFQLNQSLPDAGQMIGFLERLLIFIFIMVGKWEGVGFLLAAKSVFRFGDLKEAKDIKLTEYVLIGTLMSFGTAIIVGMVVQYFY
jgi:hypothetical protein